MTAKILTTREWGLRMALVDALKASLLREQLLEALRCALAEIHNPGACSHDGIDISAMIESAIKAAEDDAG